MLFRSKDKEKGGYFASHLNRLLQLELTPEERLELIEIMKTCQNHYVFTAITELMSRRPFPEYQQPLIEALSSPLHTTRRDAAMALIAGKFPGCTALVLSNPLLVEDMGPELPLLVCDDRIDLSEPAQRDLLHAFCRTFAGPPYDGKLLDVWLWMLGHLTVSDEKTALTLQRLLEHVKASDARYMILRTMVTHLHPSHRAAFEKASKSRSRDLREAGQVGLLALRETHGEFDRVGSAL